MPRLMMNGKQLSGVAADAVNINYDNAASGLVATTVQEAVDEVKAAVPFKLAIDENGNYGYIKDGADTVTPFKSGRGRTHIMSVGGTCGNSSNAEYAFGWQLKNTEYVDTNNTILKTGKYRIIGGGTHGNLTMQFNFYANDALKLQTASSTGSVAFADSEDSDILLNEGDIVALKFKTSGSGTCAVAFVLLYMGE